MYDKFIAKVDIFIFDRIIYVLVVQNKADLVISISMRIQIKFLYAS